MRVAAGSGRAAFRSIAQMAWRVDMALKHPRLQRLWWRTLVKPALTACRLPCFYRKEDAGIKHASHLGQHC